VNRHVRFIRHPQYWAWKKRVVWYTDDPGGFGREAVREVALCAACAAAVVEEEEHRSVYARGPPPGGGVGRDPGQTVPWDVPF